MHGSSHSGFAIQLHGPSRRPTRHWRTTISTGLFHRFLPWISPLVLLMLVGGCGTNLDEVIYNAIRATAQTQFDLFLTDVANDVADALERDTVVADEDDDADETDDGEGTADDGEDVDDTGDDVGGADGAALFAANCSACHGEDGASGFAPDISGKSTDELSVGLELATHGAISLSDEEVAAIAAFLGAADMETGDPVAGEALFTALGCTACHCADATGGCLPGAPSLIDAAVDTIEEKLVGEAAHTGGKFDVDATDLADLEAYLASLN